MALLALAVGAIIRHIAGAITGTLGFVLVLSNLADLLPGSLGEHVSAYLPGNAGQAIVSSVHDPGALLSPWQGFGVMCLWVALLLVAAGNAAVRPPREVGSRTAPGTVTISRNSRQTSLRIAADHPTVISMAPTRLGWPWRGPGSTR
jgi:hypothetical protein